MIAFHRWGWCDEAAAALAGAVGFRADYTLDDLAADVRAHRTCLFAVIDQDANTRLGWVTLWIEDTPAGREMVIQAGAHDAGQARGWARTAPALDRLAADHGCTSLRLHAQGPARTRLFQRAGYQPVETIMRKAL